MNEDIFESAREFIQHPIIHITRDETLYLAAMAVIILAGLGILAAAITLAVRIAMSRAKDDNRVEVGKLTSPTLTEAPPAYVAQHSPAPKPVYKIPPYEIVPNTIQPNRHPFFRDEPLMA